MSIKSRHKLADDLNIIWTIASKDIGDALKNKVVVSMIIMLSIMLLVPKMLPLIFEPAGQKSKIINEALRKELIRIRREKVTEKLVVVLKSRGAKVSEKEIVKLLKQDRNRKT